MNFILSNKSFEKEKLEGLSDTLVCGNYKGIFWCRDNQIVSCESPDNYLAFIQGYVNDFSIDKAHSEAQNESAINKMLNNWPAENNVSGSFSITVMHPEKDVIMLFNDVIGFYPLYMYAKNDQIVITSSLIWASSIVKTEFDSVGIAQRSIGKEYANLGSRTILKGFKRVLPGESITLDLSTLETTSFYDNTLYNTINSTIKPIKSDYSEFWEIYKREVDYASEKKSKLSIALSGGMDSRILLGAISESKKTQCLTYGSSDSYEVKVAKKVAKKRHLEFYNYEDLQLYFPSKDKLVDYVKATEALYVISWLEILENRSKDDDTQLLFGDMCEVLPARNIKVYSGRETRISNFIKTNILNQPFKFTQSTNENFETWKERKTENELKRYSKQRLENLDLNISHEILIEGVKTNLNELFDRIKSHQLPYSELYDELYAWYTHSRIPMGKQILLCNSKYSSICPPMGLSILRAASNIHPNNRLNYRFMRGLFKYNPDLKKLNTIPTNQSPWIPQNVYAPFIFLAWGIRSKMDQFLIRRIMKKKNPNLRYRMFKGLNWVKIYQNNTMEDKLALYFTPNHLGKKLTNNMINTIIARKELKKWPLTNTDLISLSSLNIELEIIKQNHSKL